MNEPGSLTGRPSRARTRIVRSFTSRHRIPLRCARLGFSTRYSPWTAFLIVALSFVVLGVAAWSMTLGAYPITVREVIAALWGSPVNPQDDFIVVGLRAPRVVTALLAGAALAMSGAIFQALVRNPLAAPDIIGVNAGAGVVVVFLIVTGMPAALIAPGAFVGALTTAVVVYLLTWRRGVSGARLVLVGIGVNAILSALITLLIIRFPVDRVSLAVWWQAGTLHGSTAADAWLLVVGCALLVPIALRLTSSAHVMTFGDDAARGLGVRVEPARAGLLLVGSGLAATAVAAVGPIGFIALISPHIARMLAGHYTSGVLLLSALIGATIVLLADTAAQHAFAFSVPVGVLTAAVGAPYFLYLMARAGRRARA